MMEICCDALDARYICFGLLSDVMQKRDHSNSSVSCWNGFTQVYLENDIIFGLDFQSLFECSEGH